MGTDLEKLKGFILTGQAMAEQGECLMLNVNDILNEIERLQALTINQLNKNKKKSINEILEAKMVKRIKDLKGE